MLEYNLRARSFVKGYHVWFRGPKRKFKTMGYRLRGPKQQLNMMGLREAVGLLEPRPRLQAFDPNSDEGPPLSSNTCHLNSVCYEGGLLSVSGTRCAHLLNINGSKLASHARIPNGTLNTRPFGESVLLNDTRSDRVSNLGRDGESGSFPIEHYDEGDLLNSHLPQDHAPASMWTGSVPLGRRLDRRRVIPRYRLGLRPQQLQDPQDHQPDDGRTQHHTRSGSLAFLATRASASAAWRQPLALISAPSNQDERSQSIRCWSLRISSL